MRWHRIKRRVQRGMHRMHRLLLTIGWVEGRVKALSACSISGKLRGLLKLSKRLCNLLQLLNGCVMALQRILNNLTRLVLTLGQFFQSYRILLLLLEKLLIILAGLLCLAHKLLNDLFAMTDLAGKV